jgi:tyrosine aminotransferase
VEIEIEKFTGFANDLEFVEELVREESVLCLPGKCFKCPKPFVRIVFSSPKEVLEEAMGRIKEFCERHYIA